MSFVNAPRPVTDDASLLQSLDFYAAELKLMNDRLAEVAAKNTGFEARSAIEHFQNQFIVQKNNIDELRHTVKEQAHAAAEDARRHAGRVDKLRIGEQEKTEDEVHSFEKVVNELRAEFNRFLSDMM